MTTHKKGAVKGMIFSLAVMTALTFFSRTIYNGTLPKVEAQLVGSGVLQTEISGGTFLLDSDQSERVGIPFDLSDYKLRIEQVSAQKFTIVQTGDVLLRFDAVFGANALEKADTVYQRATETLAAWDQKYQAAWRKLIEGMDTVSKKMTEPDADIDGLNVQLQNLRDEQSALERTRMLDGVTRMEKEQALATAKEKLVALNELAAQDWTVKAPLDGLIGDILIKSGDEYAGLMTLVQLIPVGTKLRMGIENESKVIIPTPDNVIVYSGDDAPQGSETGWLFTGETSQGNKRVFWAEPVEGIAALNNLSKLTFRIDSDYYSRLVPNSAVVGNVVFVLDSRVGAFGAEEYYARRVELRGKVSDSKNTYVPVGLTGMDKVIVKWDRPFEDGDTVMLPLG